MYRTHALITETSMSIIAIEAYMRESVNNKQQRRQQWQRPQQQRQRWWRRWRRRQWQRYVSFTISSLIQCYIWAWLMLYLCMEMIVMNSVASFSNQNYQYIRSIRNHAMCAVITIIQNWIVSMNFKKKKWLWDNFQRKDLRYTDYSVCVSPFLVKILNWVSLSSWQSLQTNLLNGQYFYYLQHEYTCTCLTSTKSNSHTFHIPRVELLRSLYAYELHICICLCATER